MSSKYTAFISYSHRDSTWARWLQRALETYRIPKTLSNELGVSRKLGKVFRDREELPTGQNLGDHLTQALENSDNLIVICSPQSKASPWVAKEIEYFKSLGKGDRIFCLLVEGGAEALAEPLLYDLEGNALEPLAADPRKDADGKHLAKLKLVSGILETNLDQLAQREKARQQRLLTNWAAFGFVVLTTIAFLIQSARNEAQLKAVEIQAGIDNVATMTSFFKRAFDYYDVEMLSSASDDFSKYLTRFPAEELNTEQRVVKGEALRILARAQTALGNTQVAEEFYKISRDLFIQASEEEPDNVELAIESAFADFYLGDHFIQNKQFELARAPITSYAQRIEVLASQNPNHELLIAEQIYAPTARLKLELDASEFFTPEMKKIIETSTSISEQIILENPGNVELASAYHTLLDYFGDAYHKKSCRILEALPYRENSVAQGRFILSLDPGNRRYLRNLSNSLSALASLLMGLSQPDDAIPLYMEALAIQTKLEREDPQNGLIKRRLLNLRLELLAVSTYHPSVLTKYPDVDVAIRGIDSRQSRQLAKSENLEALWLGRLAHQKLALGKYEEAGQYSSEMRALAQQNVDERVREQYSMLHALHHRVISSKTPSLARTSTIQAYLATQPTFPDTGDPIESGESCQNRLASWAFSVFKGESQSAIDKAKRDWSLGSRGLELAFFSKQLGFPPLEE